MQINFFRKMFGVVITFFSSFFLFQTVYAEKFAPVEFAPVSPATLTLQEIIIPSAIFVIIGIVLLISFLISLIREFKNFSRYEALKTGWRLTWKNVIFFIPFLIISYILVFLPELITMILSSVFKISNLSLDFNMFNPAKISLYAGVMVLVKLITTALVATGMIRVAFNLLDDKKVSLQKIFTDRISVKNILFFVIACLLYKLLVVLGLFILVIPGIIIGVMFSLWPFFMVDKGYDPIKSLIESLKTVQGINVWDVFLFIVLCSAINVVGLLVLGVGLFITIPLTLIAFTQVYRQLTMSSRA